MPGVISTIAKQVKAWKSRTGPHTAWVSRVSQFKYASFKELLEAHRELLSIVGDLEGKLRGSDIFGMSYIRAQATRAVFHTLRAVKKLNDLSGGRYTGLVAVHDGIYRAIKAELERAEHWPVREWVIPFSRITREMVDWVGAKNATLGELINEAGLPVPEGFAITTAAHHYFLTQNNLVDAINPRLRNLDPHDSDALARVSEEIRTLIMSSPVPPQLEKAILLGYDRMLAAIRQKRGDAGALPSVALRSSAIGRDSELSYAGLHESAFNVPRERIVQTYPTIVASLYTPRAMSYRLDRQMVDADLAMAVVCMEMMQSVCSGVIYSRYPFDASADAIRIKAMWGLAAYAEDDAVSPDTYLVSKDEDLTILQTTCPDKAVQLTAAEEGGLCERPVDRERRGVPCLASEQVRELAGYAARVEKHFGHPQVVEWSLEPDGRLLVLQTRPLHLEAVEQDSVALPDRTQPSSAGESSMKQTLRRVADFIVPLHVTDPEGEHVSPESCRTLHDIVRLARELAYNEMFRISDIVSDTSGAGAMKLKAPVLLDLRIIDLGGGLAGTHTYSRSVTVDQVTSIPFRAVLQGMLHEDVRYQGPRPINVGGFLSVMRQQMLAPNDLAYRFGDRSYALISDAYLNFSSRIGYHYSVLDTYAGKHANKNHITFSFKGGAADDVSRNRRARAIASIFEAFDFTVEVREDRVEAHFSKHDRSLIETRLEMIGRLLQFTRQMDMLTQCEESVDVLAKSFLNKNYSLEGERLCEISPS